MGLNSGGSDNMLLLLPATCMLVLSLGSDLFRFCRRFPHALGFLLLVQVIAGLKIFRTLSVTLSQVLTSRQCLRIYSLVVVFTLAEVLLVQTCGMNFPQLTLVSSTCSPLLTVLGFCYAVGNILQSVELLLMTILCLVQLFEP